MRWDLLFDDLESQLDREQRDEERALAIEDERLRLGRLTLRDRLTAVSRATDDGDAIVRVELHGGVVMGLRPLAFGRDWMSAESRAADRRSRQCVVPLAAIAAVLPSRSQLDPSLEPVPESSARLAERIGLSFVLRDLCRRRAPMRLTTVDGMVHGTLDRVARDHVDLALHEPGSLRREREIQGYRIVPLARVLLIEFD